MHSIILELDQLRGPSFFSKCPKFDVDFRSLEKSLENIVSFGENWIWIGCVKHSVLTRENTCHLESIC